MPIILDGDITVAPPPIPTVKTAPPTPATVTVLPVVGPGGPPGAPGAPGGTVHTHAQTAPAATWVIDHGLNRKVHVSLFDSAEQVVHADIVHGTPNQTTITFANPVAGSAVIS